MASFPWFNGFLFRHAAYIASLYMLLLGGCAEDSGTYPASGTVTFGNGMPVAGARIEFQLSADTTSPTASAYADADGHFVLRTFGDRDGALPGEHKVTVHPPMHAVPLNWERNIREGRTPVRPPEGPQIAEHYRSFHTTDLLVTVTKNAEANEFKIVLRTP